MNDTELDQRIRDCFLAQRLSQKSVESILARGRQAQAAREKRSWWRPWIPVAAAAAVIMFVAFHTAREYDVSQFARQVAGEIAMRHNGDRPFDIEASSFDAVQNGLKDLAFSVTPAVKEGVLSAYEILGARYCYLEGQQGVHLRVRNRASGAFCTLYIASLKGPLANLKATDREVHLEGNDVKMWEDRDRLFAIVE